jgi:hypothetical protein
MSRDNSFLVVTPYHCTLSSCFTVISTPTRRSSLTT